MILDSEFSETEIDVDVEEGSSTSAVHQTQTKQFNMNRLLNDRRNHR